MFDYLEIHLLYHTYNDDLPMARHYRGITGDDKIHKDTVTVFWI